MKTIMLFLALSTLALTLGCSSVTYKYDYDKSADFAALKTYAWVAVPTNPTASVQAALQRNDLLDKRIKESANNQLAAKGYTQSADNPDFLKFYNPRGVVKSRV